MATAGRAGRTPVAPSPASSRLLAADTAYVAPWKRCHVCLTSKLAPGMKSSSGAELQFQSPRDFCRHLREQHCTREGGSYVCLYGPNGVCPSLPVEGVSDKDYEDHVARDHVGGRAARGDEVRAEGGLDSPHQFDIHRDLYYNGSPLTQDQDLPGPAYLRHPPRRDSASAPPTPAQPSDQWTVYSSKVNLPAALNDPRLARRETDFFTKTWGEGFEQVEVGPSPWIPHITRKHFQPYLEQTAVRHKKHVRNREHLDTGRTQASGGERAESATGEKQLPPTRKSGKLPSEMDVIPKIFLQPGFSLQNPETFNIVFPWNQVEPLRQDQPLAGTGREPAGAGRESSGTGKETRQSSKLLQERLGHYLDVVEVQISRQVSLRSEAFFDAMVSHDELQDHLKNTCSIVLNLRSRVRHLSRILVEDPLKVLRETVTRSNYIRVYNKLKFMAVVHQTQPTIQYLLATNDFVGALQLIATTQEVLSQELAGIQSFKHLGSQLVELEKMIEQMMSDEFASLASAHLNQPITPNAVSMDPDRLLTIVLGALRQHKYNFIDTYKEEAEAAIKTVVKQTVIEAIVAAEDIDTDNSAASLANQMRLLNYTQWMDLLNALFSNLLVILNRVKTVSHLIRDIVLAVSDTTLPAVGSAAVTQSTGHQVSQSMTDAAVSRSIDDHQMQHLEYDRDDDDLTIEGGASDFDVMAATLGSESADTGSADSAQLVDSDAAPVRSGESAGGSDADQDLSSHSVGVEGENLRGGSGSATREGSDSVIIDSTTREGGDSAVRQSIRHMSGGDLELFLTHGESLRVVGLLRDLLQQLTDQAHDRCLKVVVARGKDGFLERLSSQEFVRLSRSIELFVDDSERISGRRSILLRSSLQGQASKFVSRFHEERKHKLSLILDNERWKQADVPVDFQQLVDHISTTGKLCVFNRKPEKDRQPQQYLYVDGQKYAVVGTVLLLLKMLVEYCQAADDIPSAAPEILNRTAELLKMFNSRTCQLILGAGALHLVGLKTISTKNLGLASRCLQLVVHYLPIVRTHFEARLARKQLSMLKHFEHLLKDYTDHIAEISLKLVSILDTMLEQSLDKWEVRAPMPSFSFRMVVKQTTKLHEAIRDLLPPQQLRDLFSKLHASLTRILRAHLKRLGVTDDSGPQHGLVMADIAYYTTAIHSLPLLTDLDLSVDSIWLRT